MSAIPLDYTADLHDLARLVAAPHATREVLERALAALRAVIPYDLAAIFRITDDRARLVAAAGPLLRPAVQQHELDLRRYPTIRHALETRRPIALEAHNHASDEGDPYDGVLDLPHGHACMVVPLFSGDRSLGLITLDRSVCTTYGQTALDIAGVYGQLISLALLFADQAALLDRYRHQLKEHNRLLTEESGGPAAAVRMLEASRSPAMIALTRLAEQVAPSDLPVLVQGETGTGKEVVCQAIHAWSARVDSPFVTLNCSAIPESLVESELFGHVKGAFSGADRDRQGRFLIANGGTLLLDEVGDMPLAAQAKLLRVLQDGTLQPVGADHTVRVDVRVIAATHVDLAAAVRARTFREDLFYRLAVFPLHVPPLRERTECIEGLTCRFLETEHRRSGRGPWTITPAALLALQRAPWPGNVRQLINALERAIILQPRGELSTQHFTLMPGRPVQAAARDSEPLPTWKENERSYFERLLAHTSGKLYGEHGAARIADLKPTTLRSKLIKHGMR